MSESANFYSDHASGWEHMTPDTIFDFADTEFGPFTLDPASRLGCHTSNVILSRGGDICIAPPSEPFEYVSLNGGRVFVDGLAHEWAGRVWLNHPYGREDWRWIKKARDSVRSGAADIVCALVPVKPQMRWWQRYVCRETNRVFTEDYRDLFETVADRPGAADLTRFLAGRVRFGDSTTGPEPYSAPFASALVVWRK